MSKIFVYPLKIISVLTFVVCINQFYRTLSEDFEGQCLNENRLTAPLFILLELLTFSKNYSRIWTLQFDFFFNYHMQLANSLAWHFWFVELFQLTSHPNNVAQKLQDLRQHASPPSINPWNYKIIQKSTI